MESLFIQLNQLKRRGDALYRYRDYFIRDESIVPTIRLQEHSLIGFQVKTGHYVGRAMRALVLAPRARMARPMSRLKPETITSKKGGACE